MHRTAAIAGLLAATGLAATPASAGVQMVNAVIAPVLSVPIDASGKGSAAPHDGFTVTTEERGSLVVITVVPAV